MRFLIVRSEVSLTCCRRICADPGVR